MSRIADAVEQVSLVAGGLVWAESGRLVCLAGMGGFTTDGEYLMPSVGGRSVTTFHTVWNTLPAVRYQPGRSSFAARVKMSINTSL